MKTPDWTTFRTGEADPQGPCCLLEKTFPLDELPRNYIWTLGYLGRWKGAEEAEISAQVKSYSREWLLERAEMLQKKKEEMLSKEQKLKALAEQARKEREELTRLAQEHMIDESAIRERINQGPLSKAAEVLGSRKIEASPLDMAKGLVKTAVDLATGGVTDPSARMDICKSCPFMGDDQRCGKCGCFLPAKTRVKKSSCPIGKW